MHNNQDKETGKGYLNISRRLPEEEDIQKKNRPQTDDKLSELIYHISLLNQHEHLRNMETEEKDTSQKSRQHPKHTHWPTRMNNAKW